MGAMEQQWLRKAGANIQQSGMCYLPSIIESALDQAIIKLILTTRIISAIFFSWCLWEFSSRSGIVNVYDAQATRALPSSAPTPLKTLPHLTTAITSLRFNHDAQILASASKTKKDQLKLVSAMRSQLRVRSTFSLMSTPLCHQVLLSQSPMLSFGHD